MGLYDSVKCNSRDHSMTTSATYYLLYVKLPYAWRPRFMGAIILALAAIAEYVETPER